MDAVPLWAFIILQIVLVILNALLTNLSVSVDSLSDGKIKKLAEEGDKDAIDMLHIENIDKKLSAAVAVATVLLNTFGAIYITHPMANKLTNLLCDLAINDATVLVKTVITVVILLLVVLISVLLGRFVPLSRAQTKYTEKDLMAHRKSAAGLYSVFKPIVWLMLKLSGRTTSSQSSQARQDAVPEVTEDEILLMVDAVEESGAIESNEKQMIENIFSFSTTTAAEVMTHRTNVIAIDIEDDNDEILNTIITQGKSRFPVYEGDIDHIVGILMARDYMNNIHTDSPKPLKELLRKPYIVPGSIKTNLLFKNMQITNTHIAVVVDEYGGTSGIVTLEDLLEELVGNIYDESDMNTEESDITKLEENVWRVAGDVDLETLSEALLIDLPEDEDYDTVGGMVLSKLTAIPDDEEHPEVFVNGLYIYVEETKERRIRWTKVSLVMTVEEYAEDEE
ncbi:MAG: HlyC/CorC family transporter [Clostridiales bacterium]|nr:HlyC/CorC family transporter [Clostridiales bacterium]